MAEGTGDGVTRRQAMGRGTAIAVGAAAGAAVAGAPAASAARRHHGPGGPPSVLSVSLEEAERVIEAAQRKAEELGAAMYIVVVDSSGVEKASRRMDGNSQASPTLAPLKAQTANGFRTPTHTLAEANAGDPARIASIASAPGFTLLGGGVPLRDGDTVIGAIGVGGGSPAQDVAVAEAGAAALS